MFHMHKVVFTFAILHLNILLYSGQKTTPSTTTPSEEWGSIESIDVEG